MSEKILKLITFIIAEFKAIITLRGQIIELQNVFGDPKSYLSGLNSKCSGFFFMDFWHF